MKTAQLVEAKGHFRGDVQYHAVRVIVLPGFVCETVTFGSNVASSDQLAAARQCATKGAGVYGGVECVPISSVSVRRIEPDANGLARIGIDGDYGWCWCPEQIAVSIGD